MWPALSKTISDPTPQTTYEIGNRAVDAKVQIILIKDLNTKNENQINSSICDKTVTERNGRSIAQRDLYGSGKG